MYEFAVAPAVTSIRRRGVAITAITPSSIGAEFELEPGDRVIKVNGRIVRDYLDFRFQTGGETDLTIEVRKQSGEDWELQIERDEGEDLVFCFEQIVPRQCCQRVSLLFLQRQSGACAPVTVYSRRRCPAFISLWQLYDADLDHRG
jgi:hypothetical protein